jgi:hypothetical protein
LLFHELEDIFAEDFPNSWPWRHWGLEDRDTIARARDSPRGLLPIQEALGWTESRQPLESGGPQDCAWLAAVLTVFTHKEMT